MNGHSTRTWRVFFAALACLAMVAAACGGDDGDDAGGKSTAGATKGGGDDKVDAAQAEIDKLLPESMKTEGVAADAVSIGYLLNDSSNAEAAGIQSTELATLQARQQFWVDYINENGGVGGKQIKVNWGKV